MNTIKDEIAARDPPKSLEELDKLATGIDRQLHEPCCERGKLVFNIYLVSGVLTRFKVYDPCIP